VVDQGVETAPRKIPEYRLRVETQFWNPGTLRIVLVDEDGRDSGVVLVPEDSLRALLARL
jgi:hypothetical protein